MRFGRRVRDPDDPHTGKAWAAGVGVALCIVSLGLLTWMAVDVDGDGMSSYAEFRHGTSPVRGDTDGDGVADGWELTHGSDALDTASTPDLGAPDLQGGLGEVQECGLGDRLMGGCDDEGDASAEALPSQAQAPPQGGNGTAGTFAIGGVTTLVAGVASRLISQGILHK